MFRKLLILKNSAIINVKPNTSINWSRHWKKALLALGCTYAITDYYYEYTLFGTVLRSVKESPTKWLNPSNIGTAVETKFTLEKPYLGEKNVSFRGRPTLCVDLNGVLVATIYDTTAMRFVTLKRPGLDLFLERLSSKYELILWSSHGLDNCQELSSRMDPEHKFIHDAISIEVERSEFLKDLKLLGRPVQRVLVVDARDNEQNEFQDNTIVIPKWTGDPADRALYNVLPFLEYMATQSKHFDLPKYIRAYKDYAEKVDKPLAFAFLDHQEKQEEKDNKKWFWSK